MASERQVEANRRNARKSTGPKSQAGRGRAARNALKHGLATTISNGRHYPDDIDRLATEIAGHTEDLNILDCARIIATAQFELNRVRRVRIGLIEGARVFGATMEQSPGGSCEEPSGATRTVLSSLQSIIRYEQRATAKRDKALRRLLLLKADRTR